MTKEFLDRLEAGLSRLISELETTRVRCRQLETEADNLRIHGADRDRLEARVADLEQHLRESQQDSQQFKALRGELESTKSSLNEALTATTRLSAIEGELHIAHRAIIELEEESSRISADRDAVRSDLYTATQRIAELEATVVSVTQDRDGACQEAAGARNRVTALEGWNSDLVRQRDELHGQLNALTGRIVTLEQERDAALAGTTQCEGLHAEAEVLRSRLYDAEFKALEAEESRQELERLKAVLDASANREAATRERLDGLILRLEETESLLNSAEVANHVES